ncbi:hypothetical protein MKK65_29515 [Methylobacterium sp. J-001]|uniref:hypothetical protein n=1 Tax=unclassified Methylobacterium TaxID=2615210 RepID=UPI000A559286|nr:MULTISPECIES: hypothetical protein [unclassified Methylobacterium]MCJ2120647.1 hypothetical protein [Methylobacterium sp. J-001]
MSRHPAWNAIDRMENDTTDLRRWASVLNRMGCSGDPIDPEDVFVISKVLSKIGERLDTNRREAFDMVRGKN